MSILISNQLKFRDCKISYLKFAFVLLTRLLPVVGVVQTEAGLPARPGGLSYYNFTTVTTKSSSRPVKAIQQLGQARTLSRGQR